MLFGIINAFVKPKKDILRKRGELDFGYTGDKDPHATPFQRFFETSRASLIRMVGWDIELLFFLI